MAVSLDHDVRPIPSARGVENHVPTAEPLRGVHVPALDAVRGLAILMVTGFRFNPGSACPDSPDGLLARLLGLGDRGVDLFFVLSGFLITGILADARTDPRYFRNFYVRRALRIFPLYFGVLVGTFVLLPVVTGARAVPYRDADLRQPWLWCYGTNIKQALDGAWSFGYFNHFWSLAVEEHFYLVWPVVIFACSRGAAMWVSVGCMVVAFGLRVVLHFAGGQGVAIEGFTLCRMDALTIGGVLALVARGRGGLAAMKPWAGRAVLAGGVVWFLLHRLNLEHHLLELRYTLYAWVFGAVIIWAVTADRSTWAGRFWNAPVLRFFGKYSYGLYVFQNLLLPVFTRAFPADGLVEALGSHVAGRLAYVALCGGGTLAVAVVSWHAYEKHFLKLKVFFQTREPGTAGLRGARCG